MSNSNANNPSIMRVDIGSLGAGTPLTKHALCMSRRMYVKAMYIMNEAALAGDDVNNVLIELKNGANVMGSYLNNVASGGLADKECKAASMDELYQEAAAGSDLILEVSHGGSGQALTDAALYIEYFPI